MGRRNINTTKSGKYMNPTDQARKEARKRELKKNKKQRQMVRTAVLKGKDPTQILMEMEKMDTMEYNVEAQPLLSDKVLKDKRKKLKETLDRVMKLYEKENPEYWVEIRRLEGDYEKKRQARIEYYEAVRHAQAVTVDEIPLPNLELPPDVPEDNQPLSLHTIEFPQHIPIPTTHHPPAMHGILKKSIPPPPPDAEPKKPPGCPPTLPPDFSDIEDNEEGDEDGKELHENIEEGRSRKIRFVDSDEDSDVEEKDTRLSLQKSKKKLTQDVDDFMRETEVLFKEKEAEKQDQKEKLDKLEDKDSSASHIALPSTGPASSLKLNLLPLPPGVPPSSLSGMIHPPGVPPVGMPALGDFPPPPQLGIGPPGVAPSGVPPLMLRPPPRPHGLPLGVRLPIGPPPPGLHHRLPNMRLPPPMGLRHHMRFPGIPPGMLPPPGMQMRPMHNPSNVLSAGPQLIQRPKEDEKSLSATIEAKPQIRSLSADVTRFLPTALRVKREDKKKGAKLGADLKDILTKPEEADRKPTKDDAYSQFMKEMENLL